VESRDRKLIEHAIEEVALEEDIFSVLRWLLHALGIRFSQKFVDYAVINGKHIRGHTLSGAADKAVRRTLTFSERKRVKVIPEPRKELIMIRRELKSPGSSELAQKVVDYLIQMGGKTI